MNQKLVSIIIPAYNSEKYIEESIKSALSTKYSNFEIVIVNDGSTDNTQSIINKMVSENSVIRSYYQKNAGASAARNHAISKAKGEYILPLDSDNCISPDYVGEAVKVLDNNHNVKLVTLKT
jgi:glycosyltransferase involved in cell wall biosynthesis